MALQFALPALDCLPTLQGAPAVPVAAGAPVAPNASLPLLLTGKALLSYGEPSCDDNIALSIHQLLKLCSISASAKAVCDQRCIC